MGVVKEAKERLVAHRQLVAKKEIQDNARRMLELNSRLTDLIDALQTTHPQGIDVTRELRATQQIDPDVQDFIRSLSGREGVFFVAHGMNASESSHPSLSLYVHERTDDPWRGDVLAEIILQTVNSSDFGHVPRVEFIPRQQAGGIQNRAGEKLMKRLNIFLLQDYHRAFIAIADPLVSLVEKSYIEAVNTEAGSGPDGTT